MKKTGKILSVLLSVLMLLSSVPVFAFGAVWPGDVNADGVISFADARLAGRQSLGYEQYEQDSVEFQAADISHDGIVTASDVRIIMRAAVKLERYSEEPLSAKCDHIVENPSLFEQGEAKLKCTVESADNIITVSVAADGCSGLIGADFVLFYDADALTYYDSDRSSDLNNSGSSYISGLPEGAVYGTFYFNEVIPDPDLTLIEISFSKKGDVQPGDFRLNAVLQTDREVYSASSAAVVLPGCEHEWSDWEITRESTCAEAGEMRSECLLCGEVRTETLTDVIPHTDQNGDLICDICGADAKVLAGGKCGENAVWTLNHEGIVTIGGTGVVTESPWNDCKDQIFSIVIEDGITGLAGAYLYDSSSLKEITIPGSVRIVDGVFHGCDLLETIILHEGVERIKDNVFFGCSGLNLSVLMPKSIQTIEDSAFRNAYVRYVYYAGSEADWAQIQIEQYNENLQNAEIFYNTDHIHVWDDGTVTKIPLCTEGEMTYQCTICSAKRTGSLFPTHLWDDGEILKPATCREDGEIKLTCTNCGETTISTVYGAPHEWDDGVVTVPASGSAAGETVYTCAVCGNQIKVPVGKKIRNVKMDVQRSLNSVLDLNTNDYFGVTRSEYNVSNLYSDFLITYEDGSVSRYSRYAVWDLFRGGDWSIKSDVPAPAEAKPGDYTLTVTFMNKTYTQKIRFEENSFVRFEITDAAPFTLCCYDEANHLTRIPVTYLSASEEDVYLDTGMGNIQGRNAGTADAPVLAFGEIKSNAFGDCKWYRMINKCVSFLWNGVISGVYRADGFVSLQDIVYDGKFTSENIDTMIDVLIVSGFYKNYTDLRFEVQTGPYETPDAPEGGKTKMLPKAALKEEDENTESEEEPVPILDPYETEVPVVPTFPENPISNLSTRTLFATEAQLRQVFSLWFADVSTFDLSLSKCYDPSIGAFVTSRRSMHMTDGGGNPLAWYHDGKNCVCSVFGKRDFVFDDNGKVLAIRKTAVESAAAGLNTDTVKETDQGLYALAGVTAADLLQLAGVGAKVTKANGAELKATDLLGSGMVLIKADGSRETIVVRGDVTGDGKITAADARLALRQAVGLDQPKDWEKAAALVNGGEKVNAAAARKILRIAVGLDQPVLTAG